MHSSDLIAVARGDKEADLILKNSRVINTFTGTIEKSDVAIYQDRIAGVGEYTKAKKINDLDGDFLAPGFIDGHTHVESSMLHPAFYAQAVVTRGTTSLATDLHEITNVCGFSGIDFFIKWANKLPLDMFIMVPSCVPATDMETSGAEITPKDISRVLKLPNVIGLGEVMNFPGVIFGDKNVLKKIRNARGRVIDGHAPGVHGNKLNAYISAGIRSDHECTRLEEAEEKLSRGMYIMIREGSSEKNLKDLLPLVTDKTYKRCLFVVDDRSCSDLLIDGDIDAVIRKAITEGLDPVRAIQLATINPAEYFRLYDRGAIAAGYVANIISFNDLNKIQIENVFYKGKLVAQKGLFFEPLSGITKELSNTVNIKPFKVEALKLKTDKEYFPVIEIIPGQIVTKKYMAKIRTKNGVVENDLNEDILKIVVVERHKATGNIGLGLVKGFGIKRGAIGSSVAHDSHNIIVVGVSDLDIYHTIREIQRMGGGLAACDEGKTLASLPLPIAGLLSDKPLKEVVARNEHLNKVTSELGNLPPEPFALLSFLALPVIPELKLTDKGVVDVLQFKIID